MKGLFSGALLLAAVAAVSPAAAQDEEVGKQLFGQFCAGCHGETGDGKGPLSGLFAVPIPSINDVAARNGGAFPMLQVIHVIDGRTGLRGHQGIMPTYGALFTSQEREHGDYGAVIEARGRIMSIALYLESIQR